TKVCSRYPEACRLVYAQGLRTLGVTVVFAFCLSVEPEMTADRPGFRNSTHLVGLGVAQVENGVNLSKDNPIAMDPEFDSALFGGWNSAWLLPTWCFGPQRRQEIRVFRIFSSAASKARRGGLCC
ncbi:MAG: hypothetical protein WKF37_15205, partial [Bryobacteraceae bacterium]